jgi:hypothetical protein
MVETYFIHIQDLTNRYFEIKNNIFSFIAVSSTDVYGSYRNIFENCQLLKSTVDIEPHHHKDSGLQGGYVAICRNKKTIVINRILKLLAL